MRLRFILSHPESGLSEEISEPDGWKDAVIKLDRHEEFHSLVEYFDGSFIFYGDNGVVNGGVNIIRSIIQEYGFDTTLIISIDFTEDDVTFSDIFNGQLSLVDSEEMPNNKIRVPIIPDDVWTKFIARLDTPVNLQSPTSLDGDLLSGDDKINLKLTSQGVRYRTLGKVGISTFYGPFAVPLDIGKYLQVDWDEYELDEIKTKYTYPVAWNNEVPLEKFSIDFDGEYYFKIRLYFTQANMIIGGGGSITFDGWYDMTRTGPDIEMKLLVNGQPSGLTFTQTDLGTDGIDGHSRYDVEGTLTLKAHDKVTIRGDVVNATLFFPMLLGTNTDDTGEQVHSIEQPPGGSVPPNFPSGLTDDSELTVTALTTFPETEAEAFLLHDAFGYNIDRLIGQQGKFYSELLGSIYTQYRQYIDNGCNWIYALVKGLQLRGYTLTEKSFFASFMQLWRGANPILNLSLSYETIQVPEVVDVSPDINLIEDLSSWQNAGGPNPGVSWDYVLLGHPFVTVNGGGGTEGYACGAGVFNEDQLYPFDTEILIQTTGVETPNILVTWAILDASFNELDTQVFNYVGPGVKQESFLMTPIGLGAYFAVRIENNTPTESKNIEVTLAFSEFPQIIYHEETVIRIEKKSDQYDDTNGTSADFYNVRDITRKYDNDRIFNKVSIGYTRWESEDISGIDDPQTKKTYATRFQKVGKGIDLYSEFIGASLLAEQARRTSREKSADYKYDNETFIIAINPIPQDESPDTSPDILTFIPELDENFSGVDNLLASETRYNLRITPTRNFLRWQDYLQGALQSYTDSEFKFSSAEGNYHLTSVMEEGCSDEINSGFELDEHGDIPVTDNFLHLADLYELTIPMEWSDYQIIRANKKKPIGVSVTDSGAVPVFIKTLSYKPMKGEATVLGWAKEYLDLSVIEDHVAMQDCLPRVSQPPGEACENAITDENGNILTDEFGECIFEGEGESEGAALDVALDAVL